MDQPSHNKSHFSREDQYSCSRCENNSRFTPTFIQLCYPPKCYWLHMVVIKEIISMVIMSLKLDFHSESRTGEKYIHWEFVRSSWDPLKSAHVCWVLSEPPLSVLRNTWRSSFHLATITLEGGFFMGWQKSKNFTLNIIISLSLFNTLMSQVCHEEYTWRSSIHVPTFLV